MTSQPDEPLGQDPAPIEDARTLRTVVHGQAGLILNATDYPGDLPVITQRYVASRGSGEPTIAVNSRGAALYPSIEFDAAGGALARTELYLSKDDGVTWTEVTPSLASQDFPPQSLDPYVYADPATDRLFSIDLYVGCSWLYWSDDDGATWSSNPVACGIPVNDHQTLFSGPPTVLPAAPTYASVLYYCVNQVADAICAHSLDGGLTWSPGTMVFPGAEPYGEAGYRVCGGLHGHGHASEADGIVYLPKGHCGEAWVGVSRDNGVTWSRVLVDASVGIDGHEAIVATDSEGNAYYFFLDDDTYPHLSISRDQGASWSVPLNVSAPGVTAAKFPTIVAGDEGRIAFLYIGSTVEGGFDAEDAVMDEATWHAYVGFSLNALDAEPVFATTMANALEDPLKRGSCNGRCQGMYDFMDITINPATGQVWAALVDLCNDACAGPDGTADDPITSRGAVGVQTGGTLLRAADD
jgi:hypothetical protein